jgi:hypothetical protein
MGPVMSDGFQKVSLPIQEEIVTTPASAEGVQTECVAREEAGST